MTSLQQVTSSSITTKILVVQDVETRLDSTSRLLSEAGFAVITAKSGNEAACMIAEHHPRLVVLTRMVAASDAVAVCRAIKENADVVSTSLLALSRTDDDPGDEMQADERTGTKGPSREFRPPRLVTAVQCLLRTSHAEQYEQRDQCVRALERNQERLRILSRNLLATQDRERRRISRELHDDSCQQLALVEAGLRNLRRQSSGSEQELETLIGHLSAVSQQLRTLSHSLHPGIVEDLGLETALARLCEQFETSHDIPTWYVYTNVDRLSMPSLMATTFYRIAQEGLTNVAKHAGDARVTIKLSQSAYQWHLTIEDDGCGFDSAAVHSEAGLGFISMRERINLIGGGLEVHSAPGVGTKIRAWAPYGA